MAVQADIEPTPRRFTVDEYHRMRESDVLTEDDRVELLDGEIVEMTPIGSRHASHVDKLASALRKLEPERAIVRIQSPIRLGEYSEPEPDLALLHPRDDFYRDRHPGPDDIFLVVEVADASADFDRDVKLPLYAEHGVSTAWLLDLEEGDLEIYDSPEAGEYVDVRRPGRDETVAVPPDGAVELEVGALFL